MVTQTELSKHRSANVLAKEQCTRPIRVAIVGCGAIAQQLHLPILAGHEGAKLCALVDRDTNRAKQLAKSYGIEAALQDTAELTNETVDAAVIATPPSHHAAAALEIMRRGIHVLVEKPMATSYRDAVAMVDMAERSGLALSVGFFRRLMPSMRMFKALLDSRWLGRPLRFEVASGGFYKWGAATLGSMRKDLAGGGVLIDMGSHILDLLHYLFEGPAAVLEYRDNGRGGIESDCDAQLHLWHGGDEVFGHLEVSRTRNVQNRFRVQCERGDLEYRISDRYRIWVTPRKLELHDPGLGEPRPFSLQASWSGEAETEWYETTRQEIDDWFQAIRTGREPELSGRSALATVKVIEDCYHSVQPMQEPWVSGVFSSRVQRPNPPGNGRMRRVLITGATGFVGCRLAEVLTLLGGCQVRALVHNPANASRLARLPVEMQQGDISCYADVERAIADCDAVVHCAIGTEYGNPRVLYGVTVGGTRNLLAVARKAKLSRFVHLSTIGIHDPTLPGVIDENTPVRPGSGDVYGRNKAKAERAVLRAAQKGLAAVVLRPGCVYGPFGQTFVVNPLKALGEGRLLLEGSANTPANTVYVDNLVEAILRALEAPAQTVQGQVFTISDGDAATWGEFYGFFARQLETDLRTLPRPAGSPGKRLQPLRWIAAWVRGFLEILGSAESKALLKRALNTDPTGRLPRRLLEAIPGLEGWLRRRLRMDRPPVYRRPGPARPAEPVRVTGRLGCISIEKARTVLGYEPLLSRDKALELTWEWLHHARLVP